MLGSTVVATTDVTAEQLQHFLEHHVIYLGDVLWLADLNDLSNAADAYLSPYMYEAFNIPVLEAIAVGLPVFVSQNGSTEVFVDDIRANVAGAKDRIILIPSTLYVYTGFVGLAIHNEVLVSTIIDNLAELKRPVHKYYYLNLKRYLDTHFSWGSAAARLKQLMDQILAKERLRKSLLSRGEAEGGWGINRAGI